MQAFITQLRNLEERKPQHDKEFQDLYLFHMERLGSKLLSLLIIRVFRVHMSINVKLTKIGIEYFLHFYLSY